MYSDIPNCNPTLAEKIPRQGCSKNHISRDNSMLPVWDNGRDWRKPTIKEGGWIRICPLIQVNPESVDYKSGTFENPKYIEKEIKNTVSCVQRYIKK